MRNDAALVVRDAGLRRGWGQEIETADPKEKPNSDWGMWARKNDVGVRIGLLILALAGCAQGGDGRFVGVARTEQGACGLGFDGEGRAEATLLLRGEAARYVPSGGVLVLSGQVDAAGHVTASSVSAGADKKPFPQVFEGVRAGDVVKGRYATPRCRAAVELTRR